MISSVEAGTLTGQLADRPFRNDTHKKHDFTKTGLGY